MSLMFPDEVLVRTAKKIYRQFEARLDKYSASNKHLRLEVTGRRVDANAGYFYLEITGVTKSKKIFDYEFAVDLCDIITQGFPAKEVAEVEMSKLKQAFEEALDVYGAQ